MTPRKSGPSAAPAAFAADTKKAAFFVSLLGSVSTIAAVAAPAVAPVATPCNARATNSQTSPSVVAKMNAPPRRCQTSEKDGPTPPSVGDATDQEQRWHERQHVHCEVQSQGAGGKMQLFLINPIQWSWNSCAYEQHQNSLTDQSKGGRSSQSEHKPPALAYFAAQ